MPVGNLSILVVEDSDEDYYTTERAFQRAGISKELKRCIDGEDVINYLRHKNDYTQQNAPRPHLILLDFNLPKKTGADVLKEVKSDEKLKNIPIIILSTSSNEDDIALCYRMGASSYIPKPDDFDNYVDMIQLLKQYWFDIAALPEEA